VSYKLRFKNKVPECVLNFQLAEYGSKSIMFWEQLHTKCRACLEC
jgi:hypothetical protein